MTLERMPGPMAPEPAPPAIGDGSGGSPVALRLQVLANEHWGLLATRSLVWNESFTRAGMFLTTLTGSIVALALVAQATAFGEDFSLFALVVLAVVLFIGLATYSRLGAANYHDALCVVGMNRIRHAYLEIAPEVEPYLVLGTTDDEAGINQSMGARPNANTLVYIMASSPFVVATINAVLGGVIAVLVAQRLGVDTALAIVMTLAAAAFVFALQIVAAMRDIAQTVATYTPKFPAAGSE
jgi:small basic protein